VALQNVAISSGEPGSCAPNWLQGKPRTAKPRSAYFSCSASRPLYCGVRPHFEATFTSNSALPSWAARLEGSPDSVLIGWSKIMGRRMLPAARSGKCGRASPTEQLAEKEGQQTRPCEPTG